MITTNSNNIKNSISDVLKLLYAKAALSKNEPNFKKLKEPYLIADDEQFLGLISTDKNMPESIFNEYGIYGSKYSDVSIFNEEGTYGSEDSIYSPFNELAHYPPTIMYLGKPMGYLTKNDHISGSIDPDDLFAEISNTNEINWLNLFESLKSDIVEN